MEHKLVVCEGPARGVEQVLEPGLRVTIGRSKQATMRVDDPAVSRVHCEVVPHGEFWVVRDMESRNHVFVGKRVTQEHVLENGDVFRLGKNTAIRFRVHDSTREVPRTETPAATPVTDDTQPAMPIPGVPKVAAEGVSLVGRTLGEFRVAEKIGVSGAASSYRALQPSLNRNVLLHVYPRALSESTAFREQLLGEVRAVSPLLHPNILQLFDLEEEAGRLFLVMEWFKGASLAEHLEAKSFLPIRAAIDVAVQICDALAYAAEQQWIVTEVEPSGLLIDAKPTVKLRLFHDPSGDAKAEAHDLAYRAPELLSPNRTGDLGSAIYGVGAVLYRCVGGMPPFQAKEPDDLKAKILKDPPRDLRKLNIRASEGLCEIVGRALEKLPQNRPQTPVELARDLKKLVKSSTR